MIIIMVDDEPMRMKAYYNAMRTHYGGRSGCELHFRETVEHLCELLQRLDREGRSPEICLILDIMFGEEGNTDGLMFLLNHAQWGTYLITNDIPIVVLTNKKKQVVAKSIFDEEFEHPVGSGQTIRYRPEKVEVYQKGETGHEMLPLITERLFEK